MTLPNNLKWLSNLFATEFQDVMNILMEIPEVVNVSICKTQQYEGFKFQLEVQESDLDVVKHSVESKLNKLFECKDTNIYFDVVLHQDVKVHLK